MKKELFETGKTVDAAIDSACEKLGCLRDDCEWEIIDLPKKGFLGLKNFPAKVRVSIEVPDEKPVKAPVVQAPKPQAPRPQPESRPKPQQASKPQVQKPVRTQQDEIVVNPIAKREKQELPHPRADKKAEPIAPEEISEKEAFARNYLAEVLTAAGLKADYVITREHGGSCINIVGEGLGMVIGRRGETLDAIQYLAGLAANRGEGDYLRLTVDCGDYRLKRQGTLEDLAKKLANQVLKTNVSKTLEPMNPFERRIIHATVSEIEGVSSSSIGEEPNRRVIITSPSARNASKSGYRGERDYSRGDSSRGGFVKNRGPRRDSKPRDDRSDISARTENTATGDNVRAENNERGGYRERRGRDVPRTRQAQTAPQGGPPKQTPETESTMGISFGKIDL